MQQIIILINLIFFKKILFLNQKNNFKNCFLSFFIFKKIIFYVMKFILVFRNIIFKTNFYKNIKRISKTLPSFFSFFIFKKMIILINLIFIKFKTNYSNNIKRISKLFLYCFLVFLFTIIIYFFKPKYYFKNK